jgi:hypothetical protein
VNQHSETARDGNSEKARIIQGSTPDKPDMAMDETKRIQHSDISKRGGHNKIYHVSCLTSRVGCQQASAPVNQSINHLFESGRNGEIKQTKRDKKNKHTHVTHTQEIST